MLKCLVRLTDQHTALHDMKLFVLRIINDSNRLGVNVGLDKYVYTYISLMIKLSESV